MPVSHAREIFRRLNPDKDGYIQYHTFIDSFESLSQQLKLEANKMSNDDLLSYLSTKRKNIFHAFNSMDRDLDSNLSKDEVTHP
jgi:hypothetical protein